MTAFCFTQTSLVSPKIRVCSSNYKKMITLCTNSSIFSMARWAWSGKVRTSPTSSSSSSSSESIDAPFVRQQKSKLEQQGQTKLVLETDWNNNPTSGWPPLYAGGRAPPSSSRGPSSINSTSGTGLSSEIRQSASLADPFRPDIWRLPDDPLTVSVFKASKCTGGSYWPKTLTKAQDICLRFLIRYWDRAKTELSILILDWSYIVTVYITSQLVKHSRLNTNISQTSKGDNTKF